MADVWLFIKMLAAFRLTQNYLYDFRVAVGPSMLPTISNQGDLLLIDKLTPRFQGYRKGDIVITKNPYMPSRNLCKRVVGEECSVVECDGKQYNVPKGYLWLEGDNKPQSLDSRAFGPISTSMVIGKAVVRIWPRVTRLYLSREP